MGDDISYKHLTIKKLGWKRVAYNTMRFGWELDDAEQETTTTIERNYEGRIYDNKIYIDEHRVEHTKVSVHLYFSRQKCKYKNLLAIFPLELIYNICFLIRRIIGAILPFVFVGLMIIASVGRMNSLEDSALSLWFMVGLSVWIGLIILEGVLSRIAAKILGIKLVKR